MRASSVAAIALAAALAGACAPHELRVVDPKDPLLDGLVGWWRFDDGMGSTAVHDSSGHGNDATLVDLDTANPLTWQPGRVGQSLEIAGAGYLTVPPSTSIDGISDQVTVAGWVNFEGAIDPTDMYGTLISRAIGTSLSQHYHLSLNVNERPILFITSESGGAIPSGATAVRRFAWTYLTGTYDGATANLYVDGMLVGSLSASGRFAEDTTPVVLGANQNGTYGITERFPGRIDEITLYNRALTSDEIHQLYTGALFNR